MLDPKFVITRRETLAVERFDWGTLQWLCNGTLLPGAMQTVGLCHIFAGKSNPLHYHPNCEEVLHVLEGRGRHSLDGHWLELTSGTTILIPQGVHHNLVNESEEDMVTLIAFSTGDRQTVFVNT